MRDLSGRVSREGREQQDRRGRRRRNDLAQAGRMPTGSYRFWEERDTEPVSFGLPWEDCNVTGEDEVAGGWDVVLRIGEQDVYGLVITGGRIALSSRSDRFWNREVVYRLN